MFFSCFHTSQCEAKHASFFLAEKKRLIKGYKKLTTQSCILTFSYLLLMQQQARHMDPLPGHQLNTLLYKGWSMVSSTGSCDAKSQTGLLTFQPRIKPYLFRSANLIRFKICSLQHSKLIEILTIFFC